ncbi:RNA methyltransferase [bacterium]|nr:RNA methyltransferase [bacterium]
MPLITDITLDDPRLDSYRDLKRINSPHSAHEFIVEGEKLVERLIETGWPLLSVLLAETHVKRYTRRLPPDVRVFVLPPHEIEKLIGFNFHRGILACGRRPLNPTPAELFLPADRPLFVLAAIDVLDPENLGTIIRTAASFGVDAVLISQRCPSPFSRRVLRTSMGSVLKVPLCIVDDPLATLGWMRQSAEMSLAACVLDSRAVSLEKTARPSRLGVVVGNEGDGLPAECIEVCTDLVTIPMAEGIDSLNVAVATGIILHYYSRLAPKK